MTRILVTHADEPIGRRVVKNLYHDPDVEVIFALGSGPRRSSSTPTSRAATRK